MAVPSGVVTVIGPEVAPDGTVKTAYVGVRLVSVRTSPFNLTIVSVVVDLAGQFRGQAFAGTFRYTRTWRRAAHGTWRIIGGAVVPTNV